LRAFRRARRPSAADSGPPPGPGHAGPRRSRRGWRRSSTPVHLQTRTEPPW
jgi:hypothetical protein